MQRICPTQPIALAPNMSTPGRDPPVTSPQSGAMSSRSSIDSPSAVNRTPSLRIPSMPSAAAQHRQSFHELRGLPPSPRTSRQPSLSHIAVQDLIDNPPMRNPDPRFAGRNWQEVKVKELVNPDDLRFVDIDTGVEAATNVGPSLRPTVRLTDLSIAPHRVRGPSCPDPREEWLPSHWHI
jgi:hypothetical protein